MPCKHIIVHHDISSTGTVGFKIEIFPGELIFADAEKVLGYEFRTGRKQAGARWGFWFKVLYSSGLEKWERPAARVNNLRIPCACL